MNYQQAQDILATSSQDEWIVNDERGCFTYKADMHLHIKRDDFDNYQPFNENWATKHPDPSAESVKYFVMYGNSTIAQFSLVSVDGHRATLPMPTSATNLTVKPEAVNFAKIVDVIGDVDSYLQRSGIKVK